MDFESILFFVTVSVHFRKSTYSTVHTGSRAKPAREHASVRNYYARVPASLYSEASRFDIAGAARRELGAAKILVVCRAVGLFRRGGFEENRKKYLRS